MGTKKVSGLDSSPEAKIAEITKDVSTITKQAQSIVVSTPEQVREATAFLSTVKGRLDRIEELRVFFTKPLVEQKRRIDDLFKSQQQPLATILTTVKRAVSNYALEQERIARAEEDRLRKQREKQNEKRLEQGKPLNLTPVPVVERPSATVHTEQGRSTTKKVWRFELVDAMQVPRQYLEVNETAIRRAIQSGVREIAGVRIYEDIDISVSAS